MINILDIIVNNSFEKKTVKIGKQVVEIKTHLSSDDYASCVNMIADCCFVNGGYKPEFKEIAKRYAYLKYFTDIDLTGQTPDELYHSTQSDWYGKIYSAIANLSVFYDIEKAVDELLEYKLSSRKNSFDILCDTLSAILQENNAKNLADAKEIIKEINKVDKNKFVSAVMNKHKNKKK
jgi:hypothetical protein